MAIFTVECYPHKSFLIDVEAESIEDAKAVAKRDSFAYEEYEEQDWGIEIHDVWPKLEM